MENIENPFSVIDWEFESLKVQISSGNVTQWESTLKAINKILNG